MVIESAEQFLPATTVGTTQRISLQSSLTELYFLTRNDYMKSEALMELWLWIEL